MNFPNVPVDQGAIKKMKPKTLKAAFGDGYTQRAGDGINNAPESWSVSFSVRPKAVILSIDTFLANHGGVTPFAWRTPEGRTINVVCEEWSTTYNVDTNCSLSATFEQDFS